MEKLIPRSMSLSAMKSENFLWSSALMFISVNILCSLLVNSYPQACWKNKKDKMTYISGETLHTSAHIYYTMKLLGFVAFKPTPNKGQQFTVVTIRTPFEDLSIKICYVLLMKGPPPNKEHGCRRDMSLNGGTPVSHLAL